MIFPFRGLCVSVMALLCGSAVHASPAVTELRPAGAPRGSETIIGFVGKHLDSAEELTFYSAGFSARRVEEPKPEVDPSKVEDGKKVRVSKKTGKTV